MMHAIDWQSFCHVLLMLLGGAGGKENDFFFLIEMRQFRATLVLKVVVFIYPQMTACFDYDIHPFYSWPPHPGF